jgi:acetate kinase
MSDGIIVINAGSSSVKFSLYVTTDDGGLRLFCKGQVEGIGVNPTFQASVPGGKKLANENWDKDAPTTAHMKRMLEWIEEHLEGATLIGAGHRVVHGGRRFAQPVVVDDAIVAELEALIPLAPLHNPHNIAAIKAIAQLHPGLPQVACFDTAFHRRNDHLATAFALPRSLIDEGIQRYGFHGLSYEFIARRLKTVAPDLAAGRVVVCHLGSGASMCAVHAGRSVTSTMSFTALDGIPMGTRPGAIDPGVLLYLMKEKQMSPKDLEKLLYHQCGLLGMSGVSNDVRVLLESTDPHAAEALDYFVYRIGREIGSLAAAMGGIDGLVFTAGIGEHSPIIRARVMKQAAWLGFELDEEANGKVKEGALSSAGSRCKALVIPTDEELMIATHSVNLLTGRVSAE